MITERDKDQQAFVLMEWRKKLRSIRAELTALRPDYAILKKPRVIAKVEEPCVKLFLQHLRNGTIAKAVFTGNELINIHMRLQFAIDLISSYLAQLATGAPLDYRNEIEVPNSPMPRDFDNACSSLMQECWRVRGTEWLIASTTAPAVGSHCLDAVFNIHEQEMIEAQLQRMITLK